MGKNYMAKEKEKKSKKKKKKKEKITISKVNKNVIILLLKLNDDKIIFIGDLEHSNPLLNSKTKTWES